MLRESHIKLLRHVVDTNGKLSPDCYDLVFGAGVTERYFHDYNAKDNVFTDNHLSVIFDYCHGYREQFRRCPSDDAIVLEMSKNAQLDTFQKREINEILRQIRQHDARPGDTPLLIEMVREDYLRNMHTYLLQKSLRLKEDAGVEASMKYLQENLARLQSSGAAKSVGGSYSGEQFAIQVLDKMKTTPEPVPPKAYYGFRKWDAYAGGMFGGNLILFGAGLSVGKAQPLDTPVLTPNGWKRMGHLLVGDWVVGADGRPTRVLQVHPQGVKPIYRVTFSDGTSTECCDEHLWHTTSLEERKNGLSGSTKTLNQIRQEIRVYRKGNTGQMDFNHRIPVASAVEFKRRELPIDPYLLGVLLGYGSFRDDCPCFTSADASIVEEVQVRVPNDVTVKRVGSDAYAYSITGIKGKKNPLTTELRRLRLYGEKSEHKSIPDIYLHASISQRTELLQGLLDTDGSIDHRGFIEFCSASPALAEGVAELVRSLGGLARLKKGEASYRKNGDVQLCLPRYRVWIVLPENVNPFKLERKANRRKPLNPKAFDKKIVDVEYVGDKPAQCITVDALDHLYVTEDYIVTHNSWFLHDIALRNVIDFQKRTVLWNLEMLEHQIAMRILCRQSGIPYNRLRKGWQVLTEDEKCAWDRAVEGIRALGDHILFLDKKRASNLEQAKYEMRQHFGDKSPDLFMCDYLDKMQPSRGKYGATHERVSLVTDEAKNFALEEDLVFLSATQNNRGGNKNPNADVTDLSTLQTAKDADTLIMLTEDPANTYEAPGPDDETAGEPGIIFARFARGRVHGKQQEGFRMAVEFSTGSISECSEFNRSPVGSAYRRGRSERQARNEE